jgi:uncharacterized protein with PIN domain
MMKKIFSFFSQQKLLLEQQQELKQLRKQVDKLTQQNDSMRQGMRRCVSCDYRIHFKQQEKNQQP